MKKSYTKTIWTDSKTPVNSTNLGKIESALEYLYTNAFDSSDLTVVFNSDSRDLDGFTERINPDALDALLNSLDGKLMLL